MPRNTQCAHDDSRLTCRDCDKVICSACLVQCPVGFRCPECSGVSAKSTGPSKFNALAVVRSLVTCVVIGFGFGFLEQFIDIPWISVFLCLAVGMISGRLAAPVVTDHRIGHGISVTIVFGLLIGMTLTPLILELYTSGFFIFNAFTSRPDQVFSALTFFLSTLFNPIAFILGFCRAASERL